MFQLGDTRKHVISGRGQCRDHREGRGQGGCAGREAARVGWSGESSERGTQGASRVQTWKEVSPVGAAVSRGP